MELMDLSMGLPEEVSKVEEKAPEEYLEIYEKAKHFKKLNLLSGNSVTDGVTEEYIREHYGVKGVQRYKLASFVLDALNYRVSPDVLLMLSCTNHARVIVATAGAGKTTSLQFDIVISKALDKACGTKKLEPLQIEDTSVKLPRVLYLNYNRHNVNMISARHTAMCTAVNKLLRPEDAIDDSLESSTVHAFCHHWLSSFSSQIELPELTIISDTDKANVWGSIINPRWKKFYGEENEEQVSYTVLDELYTYKVESMIDWDEFFDSAKFVDTGLKSDFTKSCIKKYDSMKKQMKLMDFTDYLLLMIEVLKNNPDLKKRLQERYRVIIADENQDFTRLMNELLIQLYNPELNELIAVGDPDQTIYEFKGVSPDNMVSLAESLQDCQVLGLDTNYRCPETIVSAAKEILNLNVLRFEKPINTVKTGGQIFKHPIMQGVSQEKEVLKVLSRIGSEGWSNTVVTYRNNISSLIIGEELYYAKIPFTILDDKRPFNNPIFKHFRGVLQALQTKDDFQLNCDLYRFLPLPKEQWVNILKANKDMRRMHLHDLQVPKELPNGTLDALAKLIRISELIDTNYVSDYFGVLVKLYKQYYFDFIVKQVAYPLPGLENYPLFLERTAKFFNRNMTFDSMLLELREYNRDNPAGVTLSTFHGLKGLEFDYVIAIDFNEIIFPNAFGVQQKYSKNTAKQELEASNRLCYVLVTRTIKEFHMFYDSVDPSTYVALLTKESGKDSKVIEPEEELVLGTISSPTKNDPRMDFVKRLLGNRR